jgi:hypothetical protein
VTGFGSAILLSPLFSNFLPPKDVVVLIILLESLINLVFAAKENVKFSLGETYAGAFIGIAAGIVLFGLISQKIAGLIIGISMGTLSLLMLAGVSFEVRSEKVLFLSAGLISGFMGVLTGVNGPQIVLALTNQGYNAGFVRIFIITYLIVIDSIILLAFVLSGYLKPDTLLIFLILAPFVLASYIIGKRIVWGMGSEKLRKVILSVVFVSSIFLIFRFLVVFE